MVSSDTIVGIVGAVILTGAMIAVFYYENNTAEDDGSIPGEGAEVYTVVWTEETHAAEAGSAKWTAQETIDVGAEAAFEEEVSIPHFTNQIVVNLQWSDDQDAPAAGGEDEFQLELLNATGVVVDSASGATGDLTLTVTPEAPVAGEPAVKTLQARGNSTTDAEAAVKATAGASDFTVRVTLLNTNSQVPSQLPGEVGDPNNSFEVFLGYTHWHAFEESRLPTAE